MLSSFSDKEMGVPTGLLNMSYSKSKSLKIAELGFDSKSNSRDHALTVEKLDLKTLEDRLVGRGENYRKVEGYLKREIRIKSVTRICS